MKRLSMLALPIIVVAALLVSGGCAGGGRATSSGVYQIHENTYKVVAIPGQGNFMDARNLAYQEARAQCAKAGEEMHVRIEYLNRESVPPSIELTFGCP